MTFQARAAFAFSLLAWLPAMAQESARRPGEIWLGTGFATYHFKRDLNLNGRNPGVGLEYRFRDDAALTAGRFLNSDLRHSHYAGVNYQPWRLGPVRLGAVVAGFNGYPQMRDGRWFVALVPSATVEYQRFGVNVAVVPSYKDRLYGGVSVQLKVKLWE